MDVEHVLGRFPLRLNVLNELLLLPRAECKKLFDRELELLRAIGSIGLDYSTYGLNEASINARAGLDFSVENKSTTDGTVTRVLRCAVSAFQE